MHKHIGFDHMLFDHSEQVAATAGRNRIGFAELLHRIFHIARIDVREAFHASTPRSLSREIGKSFTRFPIALKIAFATAAGDGMIVGSPNVLAPNGPYGSSVWIHSTSTSGVSR